MFIGAIFGLFVGWVLSIFSFDYLMIETFRQFFNITLTTGAYYGLFAILGIISSIFKK